MVVYYLYWLYCILAALCVMLFGQYYAHQLQRTEYDTRQYVAWIKERFIRDGLPLILIGVMCVMLKICNIFFIQRLPALSYICFYGADVLYLYMLFSLYWAYRKETKETPLHFTGPVVRMLGGVFLVAFLCEMNLMRQTVYYGSVTWAQYMKPYIIGYLPGMLLPLLALVAFCVTSPHLAFKKKGAEDFYMAEDEADTTQPQTAQIPAAEDNETDHTQTDDKETDEGEHA